MIEFLPFFLVLFVSLFFSELFFRFHFPWVITLILGGVLVGPHGLDFFEINSTIEFFSQIGLIFLMFLAGLETNLFKHGQDSKFRKILPVAVINAVLPFFAGFFFMYLLGYGFYASILVGIIFISSSLAVIVPSLDANGLLKSSIGQSIVATAVILDISSLIGLSIFIQFLNPTANLPLPIFYFLLLIFMMFLRFLMPKIIWFFKNETKNNEKDIFQQQLRAVFVLLIGTVIVFELIGLHPIIAGFFTGMVLSDSLTSDILKAKLRAVGYGIFVPTFFIAIGAKTDLSVFWKDNDVLATALLLVGFSILIKYVIGYLGGLYIKLSKAESKIFASSLIPQLSTTLAVATIGIELEIITPELFSSIILISVITVLIGPFLIRFFAKKQDNKI
jgi:Kef-type K+ transport system membrane component KefB